MKSSHIKTISQSVVFGNLPPERAAALIGESKIEIRCFEKGETVYSASHFSRSLGIVLKGAVRVEKQGGEKSIIMNTLVSGSVFGMAAMFYENEAFPTEITALKSTDIAFISKEELCGLFVKEPLLCENYITLLSKKIHFLNKKIDTLGSKTAQSRLYSFLCEEYRKSGCGGTLTLQYNMQELARVLDMGRTSLYRELDSLEAKNLFTRKGKTFYFNTEEI